jgi:regulator of sigma D
MTPQQFCQCMVDYVSAHKITTLGSYLSAVTDWYKRNTLGALPRDHDVVIAVRKGILNY